MIENVFKIVV